MRSPARSRRTGTLARARRAPKTCVGSLSAASFAGAPSRGQVFVRQGRPHEPDHGAVAAASLSLTTEAVTVRAASRCGGQPCPAPSRGREDGRESERCLDVRGRANFVRCDGSETQPAPGLVGWLVGSPPGMALNYI